jgi:dTDP-glucose 4,6-dehydratase
MRLLVTGAAGFIGSNFVRMIASGELGGISGVVVLDKLTYAGVRENLDPIDHISSYSFVEGDICNLNLVRSLLDEVDAVINFAAESHVDRSINGASDFVQTNIVGVQVLLDAIKATGRKIRFLQVSTDEVYGSTIKKSKSEKDILKPSSPYSASKASADLLVQAYVQTYNIDAIITRTCNNYGPRQYPEKLIPLLILNAINNKDLPIYGSGKNVREWIHVLDNCRAIEKIIIEDKFSDIVNIGSEIRLSNLKIANIIKSELKSSSRIKFVKDRKGHDFRYAISSSLLRTNINLDEIVNIKKGITQTIDWYKNNTKWFD